MKTIQDRLREKSGQYDEYDWHSAIELEAADHIDRLEKDVASLRDEFAAKAMQSLVARDMLFKCRTDDDVDVEYINIGAMAYRVADAMLAARVGRVMVRGNAITPDEWFAMNRSPPVDR